MDHFDCTIQAGLLDFLHPKQYGLDMFDPKQFDNIAGKLFSVLPTGLHHVEQELQQKFKEILHAAFSRLDLVTREEFDVQCNVLARTREKVEALQEQINELRLKK